MAKKFILLNAINKYKNGQRERKLIKFVIRNVLSIEEKGKNTHVTIKKGFIRSNELEYIKRKLDYKDIMISAKDNGILTLIMIG